MDNKERLKNAKKHCFFVGLNDSGAELCKYNTPYGIAGIHSVQEQLGMNPNATFISTPDMTITRNESRWKSGFGYGGKISWGDGNDDFVILNTKPNACGMLVGGLEELPDITQVITRLREIEMGKMEIDGIETIYDFHKSNHFIDLFEVNPVIKTELELPPYAFIIHGSADEFIYDNKFGFGLAYEKNNNNNLLYEMAEHIRTPFGEFHILQGEDAKKYYERYKYAENFAKKKRNMSAELLFGNFTEISNETHQGLINMNELVLGCHYFKNESPIFPLALRADLPAYLVRGKPNLSEESIEVLGFEKRSNRLGVYDRLRNANILPHGGGYVLPDILTVNKVMEIHGKRYFEVEMQNDRCTQVISDVEELPYEYRGRTVVLRALETGLIDITAKLIPQYVLKI